MHCFEDDKVTYLFGLTQNTYRKTVHNNVEIKKKMVHTPTVYDIGESTSILLISQEV